MSSWNLLGVALLLLALVVIARRLTRRITVFEYQHVVRFVAGRFDSVLAPGNHWIFRPRSSVQVLEARPRFLTIPGQELLSGDGVSLKVSLLLEICVVDPKAATLNATSYEESLYAHAQTALRAAIGEQPMEETLRSRAALSTRLQDELEPAARELGVALPSVVVKDIMFPGTLKDAFSQTARAKQEAQATLERARGETAALRNLANSARIFENNPGLFQLRLLQAASESGKIVVTVAAPDSTSKSPPSEPAD